MREIGEALPTDGLTALGWRIAGGQASEPAAILVLTAWTLAAAWPPSSPTAGALPGPGG